MITVSASAATYIQQMISKEHGIGLRLSIKKTGCSGYSYTPQIVQEKNKTDIEIPIAENNLKIWIDAAWSHLLNDITIDYVEENKSGLREKRLVFINPHESSRCGCGESFHVE